MILQVIMSREHTSGGRVDVVFDCYRDISIKSPERTKRGAESGMIVKINSSIQKCPKKWSKALRVEANKASIVKFLVKERENDQYSSMIGKCSLYVTSEEDCWWFTCKDGKVHVKAVPELSCNHEKADTRLLLHAAHAASHGFTTVILQSPDTDVAVIAVSLVAQVPAQLLFRTGTGHRAHFLDLTAVAQYHSTSSPCFIGLHSFTGCDSYSAFCGQGKRKGFLLLKEEQHRTVFESVRKSFELSDDQFAMLEAFVCAMYGRPTVRDVNELPYKLFCAKGSSSPQLPPCRDALLLHARRANYQAAVWRLALEPRPHIPSPDSHGWKVEEGKLSIHWLNQLPAARQLMEFVSCGCKKGCKTARCSCRKNGLMCTDICNCLDCSNCSNDPDDGVESEASTDTDDYGNDIIYMN